MQEISRRNDTTIIDPKFSVMRETYGLIHAPWAKKS